MNVTDSSGGGVIRARAEQTTTEVPGFPGHLLAEIDQSRCNACYCSLVGANRRFHMQVDIPREIEAQFNRGVDACSDLDPGHRRKHLILDCDTAVSFLSPCGNRNEP